MDAVTEKKAMIPTEFLPEEWKAIGSEKFGLKQATISAIVFGHRTNTKVFKYFLEMAVAEKADREQKLTFLNS